MDQHTILKGLREYGYAGTYKRTMVKKTSLDHVRTRIISYIGFQKTLLHVSTSSGLREYGYAGTYKRTMVKKTSLDHVRTRIISDVIFQENLAACFNLFEE